jgi:PKHD-type hydroxylase
LLYDLSEARELLSGMSGTARAVELICKSYNNLLRRNSEP